MKLKQLINEADITIKDISLLKDGDKIEISLDVYGATGVVKVEDKEPFFVEKFPTINNVTKKIEWAEKRISIKKLIMGGVTIRKL